MKRSALLFALVVVLAGCDAGEMPALPELTATPSGTSLDEPSPTATPTPTATSPATSVPRPTATPTPVLIGGASATPKAPLPGDGWLEIRIVDPIDLDPICPAEIPFTVTKDGDRYMVDGGGPIDCEFINPQPLIGTHHHIYDLDTTLVGEVRTDIPDEPSGALHADLFLSGALTQIYTDIPPKVTQLCTEDHPCDVPPQSAPLMLVMPYVEGATLYLTKEGMVADLGGAVPAWTIILHLGR